MAAPVPLRIKIQLFCGSEIAMGPGKADLLDAIREQGSISGAGRSLNMSYRRAWQLVDTMNRCWREPVVSTSPGSGRGGGARLTPFGEMALARYRELQNSLAGAASGPDHGWLAGAVRSAPKASQKE